MAGVISTGDYVRIRDLAGYPHIGKVDFISSNDTVHVNLLTGLWGNRPKDKVEKLTIGEAMLLKLKNE
jgi:hypothetical protein